MEEELYYDEETLQKVWYALFEAGLGDIGIQDAINNMQNAGIKFREVRSGS